MSIAADRGLSTARAVLCVLSLVAETPGGVSAREVAERLHKSRSTAYHLLASLEAEGFVARVGRSGCYRLIVDKPGAPTPAPAEPDAMTPRMERALEAGMREVFLRTGRRTCIGVFSGDGVALVRDIGRQGIPRMGNLEKPLIRRTAHALAIGKLLLADLSDTDLRCWVQEHGLASLTSLTIVDPLQLQRELAEVRERGVATDHCEYDVDFGSLAAAVVSSAGQAVAAIAVTVTRAQFAAERDELELALLSVTDGLNRACAASGQPTACLPPVEPEADESLADDDWPSHQLHSRASA